MIFKKTTALKKILEMKKRLRIIQGGSSAGKTIAVLLILIDIAQSSSGRVISVVSETLPHLRRGAIRDFLSIMEAHGYYKDNNWNKSEFIYTFETGSKIEFFSADQPDKVRGPRRQILFINEANNIPLETYTQLAIRTSEDIYIDFNPVQEFWVHTDIIPKLDHDFLILTYLDNEGLPESIVKEIESRRGNKYFWQVFGLGQIGEVEGKIYKDWQVIDEVPHEARLERIGLDFGYTNDPTAIDEIYRYNGGFVVNEVCHQTGLMNRQIADILLPYKGILVIGDSSEPKSIAEIKDCGVSIIGAEKGPDSVRNGIAFVQDQRISVTKRSVNVLKEYRNYMWMTDREGKILNVPQDIFNHHMDGIRYALNSFKVPEPTISSYTPKFREFNQR